jgi:hypothetical protein
MEPDPPPIDLRDQRGRLVRLVAGVAIGAVATVVVLTAILAASARPNADPVGQSSVGLLAIAVFVVASLLATNALGALARWRAGRRG